MGALSKFDQVRLLASTLTFKQYGPGLCGLAAFFAVIKWYSKAAKSIISRDRLQFLVKVLQYGMAMPAISVTNAILKFGISEMKLRFRERLTKHLYSQYLKGFTFYKMANLDNRIQNADQLLTQDVDKFCDGLVELYSNLTKPIVDVLLYVSRIGSALGWSAPVILFSYLLGSGVFLTYLRRPIGRLTVQEQALEGEFRFVNSRLIVNSEEIAFYQGNDRERTTLLGSFANLEYYNSGRMMLKLAEALGRLALAGRELTRLSGFTTRVDTLLNVLGDLTKGSYERTMIADGIGEVNGLIKCIRPGAGELIIRDNVIRFESVPLVTPNGDVLIDSLDFEVPSGRNVLVCGPNGCGKSSLFRILGELWPLFGGKLTKPAKGKLFYVPQRPYMTLGTLRDQVIYPDRACDMHRKGFKDHDLEEMLEKVQLSHILVREGGWNAVQDWMDVLSGGEKQRIAMARLFYHKPQFAILDECTSAVSVDVEGAMYKICREMGITLFTVSHRKSLWIHHEYFLHMDGPGRCCLDGYTYVRDYTAKRKCDMYDIDIKSSADLKLFYTMYAPFFESPPSLVFKPDGSVLFECICSGNPQPTIQWRYTYWDPYVPYNLTGMGTWVPNYARMEVQTVLTESDTRRSRRLQSGRYEFGGDAFSRAAVRPFPNCKRDLQNAVDD
ncbi:ABC transporter, ATP-binding protein [Teladorsagia circumcincta]|uniref:ABC transporter, ATP-binding protein n=2 Tax=Teladorsagia circumcincta TaxID=45464 RepID=A0A2G9UWW5_TELCI|nr:ABC transporter, ATP-binding protein [Teladorsagia circumcincta]